MANMTEYLTSNYYRGEDIEPGGFIEETIARRTERLFDGKTKPDPVIYFESGKGVVLNQTKLRDLIAAFGPNDANWIDQKVVIFRSTAPYQGKMVPAVGLKPVVSPQLAAERRKAIAQSEPPAPPSASEYGDDWHRVPEGDDSRDIEDAVTEVIVD
jgi:hypothetical protein